MSLALYRSLVPAHSSISDDTVEAYLALSAQEHTASVWGNVYAQAMVWHAAHVIERTPGLGSASADAPGLVTSKRAGDLAVTYGAPPGAADDELATTTYGQRYLALRRSRAACAPTAVLAAT